MKSKGSQFDRDQTESLDEFEKRTSTYNELLNKRYTFNNVNFVAGGKPEVSNNNGVMLAFWRMDFSTTKAHIEFYYTDSKNQTTHYEYLLTKENAVWRK